MDVLVKLAQKNLLVKALKDGILKTAAPTGDGKLYPWGLNRKQAEGLKDGLSYLPWGAGATVGARALGWGLGHWGKVKNFRKAKSMIRASRRTKNPQVRLNLRNQGRQFLDRAKRSRTISNTAGHGPKAITKPINWRSPTSIVGGTARAPFRLGNALTAPAGKGAVMKYLTPAAATYFYGSDVAQVGQPNARFSWDMMGSQQRRSKSLGMQPKKRDIWGKPIVADKAPQFRTYPPMTKEQRQHASDSQFLNNLNNKGKAKGPATDASGLMPLKPPVKPVKPYGQQIRLKPRIGGAVPMPPRTQ